MCTSSRDIRVFFCFYCISAFSLCSKEKFVFSDLIMLSVSSELGSGKEAGEVSW